MSTTSKAVRVIRLIEYEFEDQDTADNQILHMTQTLRLGKMKMRSTLLQMPLPEWPPEESDLDRRGVRGE